MEYRIYQSQDFPVLRDDHPRAYAMVYEGDIDASPAPDGQVPVDVLEGLFALHNRDDRPAARRIRSLSAGDVVSLPDKDGDEAFYMVANFGFKDVPSARIAHAGDGGITVWPAPGQDGVYLSVQPSGSDSGSVLEIPVGDVVGLLVLTGRIPKQENGYNVPRLVVRQGGNALVATPTSPDEKDYPGMNLDAEDKDGATIFLANAELPNSDYPGSITARLYNGYGAFESDEPAALMRTAVRTPGEAERLGRYADEVETPRKILYVDGAVCEARDWSGDASQEHANEPPADWEPADGKGD